MKEEVKKRYKKVAKEEGCCLPEQSCCTANLDIYQEYLKQLPSEVEFKSLGCGTPLSFEVLKEGERVLDIGSGEGIEALIAALMVGESGEVVGLDMTDEMLEKARMNAEKCGFSNVRFIKGDAESIPFSDVYFDVVISNCVINLVEDKGKVFKEIFRVLKPSGRVLISDIVSEEALPEEIRSDPELWASCIGGAIPLTTYLEMLKETGFLVVRIIEQKEIRFKGKKLFSITYKAMKAPSRLKIEAEKVEDGVYVFSEVPSLIVSGDTGTGAIEILRGGIDKEELSGVQNDEMELAKKIYQELSFRDLTLNARDDDYRGRAAIKPQLKEIWLHLTQRCNLRCRHCLVEAGEEAENLLNIEEIKKILKESSSMGAKRFYVTGGEPYLLTDVDRVFQLIMKYGELVILTNATLINENLYIPPPEKSLFQVSLDGTEEVNDGLRGKGSFKKTIRGIDTLKKHGHRPIVATVVTSENLENIPELTSFLGDLGISDHHLLFLHARGRAAKGNFVPEPAQIIKMLDKAIEEGKKKGVAIDNYQTFSSRLMEPQGEKKDLCHAGVEMITIGPSGEIYPCPSLVGEKEFISGNVRRSSLREVWENSRELNEIRQTSLADCKECMSCAFRFYCGGGCLAFKYLSGGDYSVNDPYCDIYKHLIIKKLKEMRGDYLYLPHVHFPLGKENVRVYNCT